MTYISKRKPRAWQAECLPILREKKAFAVNAGMRCVDAATEYLSPTGWRKIDTYKGGLVAEFKLDGTARFVIPRAYIKTPVDKFWQFKSQGGVDQVLSTNHRILLRMQGRRNDSWRETSPRELDKILKNKTISGNRTQNFVSNGHVPTTFLLENNNSKINMTDAEIRLMVAFHADGTLGYDPKKPETPRYGYVRLYKKNKKERLRELLETADFWWQEKPCKPRGFSRFKFMPPQLTKSFGEDWWQANDAQRRVIVDEIFRWDGGLHKSVQSGGVRKTSRWYASRYETDVDFIQYCFASLGFRTSKIRRPVHSFGKYDTYQLHITGNGRTTNLAMMPAPKPYRKKHDGFMYSFTVPSTYLILRRNGKVFVTGNCGKTKVIVDDWGEKVAVGELSDIVIIAPGGAYLPWADALKDDLPDEIAQKLRTFVWVSQTAKNKTVIKERDWFLHQDGPRALIMNIEALSRDQKSKRSSPDSIMPIPRQFIWDFIRQRPDQCMVVIDESVTIKNIKSKCGEFILNALAPRVGYRRIMSGLMAPKSPSDVYNQFRFLDPKILGFEEFTTFQARYEEIKQICMVPNKELYVKFKYTLGDVRTMTLAQMQWRASQINPNMNAAGMTRFQLVDWLEVQADCLPRDRMIEAVNRMGGYVPTVPVVKGFKNEEELRAKIAPYSYRIRLEDCYDMPSVDYSFRDVEMNDEQARIYDEIKKNATAELESKDHVTASHVITQMLRLHQVLCGHVVDEEDKLHDVPERRTAALCDLLEDYEGKAIIWVSYDRSVDKVVTALKKRFGEDSVSRFWGGNVKTREAEELEFKTEPARRFMVATPDAGGRGRDWSVADLVIYFSNRNNLDHRQQSEDRAKAMGKTRPIAYVDMRVRGTVEDPILDCLRKKIDMASAIQGDQWRKWLV